MSLKKDLYLKNLLLHLGINDVNEINESHTEKIREYLSTQKDPDVLKELIKNIPDFLSYASQSIESMNNILKKVMEDSEADVSHLSAIIENLSNIINKNELNENDKDRVFDLIKDFQIMLDKVLENRSKERGMIIAGAIGITGLAVVTVGYLLLGREGAQFVAKEAIGKIPK